MDRPRARPADEFTLTVTVGSRAVRVQVLRYAAGTPIRPPRDGAHVRHAADGDVVVIRHLDDAPAARLRLFA